MIDHGHCVRPDCTRSTDALETSYFESVQDGRPHWTCIWCKARLLGGELSMAVARLWYAGQQMESERADWAAQLEMAREMESLALQEAGAQAVRCAQQGVRLRALTVERNEMRERLDQAEAELGGAEQWATDAEERAEGMEAAHLQEMEAALARCGEAAEEAMRAEAERVRQEERARAEEVQRVREAVMR